VRGETSDVRVCGELPIFDTNQQFATHTKTFPFVVSVI
jgi:hypothetical protein